jgi:hypothetical protein
MGRIINRSQSGFLKERNIVDGILTLQEILHDTRSKKKDGLILKLNFEKAYDKLNWKFLYECLKQKGFGSKWCEWIKLVMSSGTVSVKMNNTTGSYFKSGSELLMVSQDETKSLIFTNMFNCAIGKWPIKYLGVPVVGSRLHVAD